MNNREKIWIRIIAAMLIVIVIATMTMYYFAVKEYHQLFVAAPLIGLLCLFYVMIADWIVFTFVFKSGRSIFQK